MSWDIWVESPPCEHCGRPASAGELRNYTHNCNEMLRRSLAAVGRLDELGDRQLYALDGLPCARAAEMLAPALEWWSRSREALMRLNPENGWGDEASAFAFWRWVLNQCRSNPLATLMVRVSG